MDQAPLWALSTAYWLHMLATVTWIGGLAALAIFVLPAARRSLTPESYASFLAALQTRFDPLAWFSLALLAGTGMFQMSASPSYAGFLAIDSAWAAAILVKHLVFGGMAAVSGYLTWGLLPALRRLALRRAAGAAGDPAEALRLERRQTRLLNLNLALGVVVLLLTAIARSA
ncbi:MAG: CopD family protein [Chloroflexota bacterium]